MKTTLSGARFHYAYLYRHDAMRRLRRVRRHLSVRHHAHRSGLPQVLQYRAEFLLGMLLVRKSLPAECDRRSRLCGLRASRPQSESAQGTGKRSDLLEDQVSRRAAERVRIPDQNYTLGLDKGAAGLREA